MTTLLALLLAMSMLAGCSSAPITDVKNAPAEIAAPALALEMELKTLTYGVELQTVEDSALAEDGTELAHYRFQLPVLSAYRKDGSRVVQARSPAEEKALATTNTFNAQFADWTEGGDFNMLADAAAEERSWRILNGEEWPAAYELELTSKLYQTGELISIEAVYYSYAGGAHPNTCLLAWNFDLTTGQFFTPAILAADSQEFLDTVQNEIIRQAGVPLEDGTIPASGYWEDYEEIAGDWSSYAVSFDESGMTVAFSPYEIACYAAGPQVFHLSYDFLLPHLGGHGREILALEQEEK